MKVSKTLKKQPKIKPIKKAKLTRSTSMGGCGRGPEWQCGASAKQHF
jgi:hypothetical protein